MPGAYVAKRDGDVGRAGLALPFTPTKGPIAFAQDWHGLQDVPMYHHYLGKAADAKGKGLRTHLISECAVFAAAEWTGSAWGMVYFAHVQGGDWSGTYASSSKASTVKATREALAKYADTVNLKNCYSLIVCPGPYGYDPFVELPSELGFSGTKLSVYISNTSMGLGIGVEFKVMGEFGEIGTPTASHRSGPFGDQKLSGGNAYSYFD